MSHNISFRGAADYVQANCMLTYNDANKVTTLTSLLYTWSSHVSLVVIKDKLRKCVVV
jgi:hypothetical protein